VEEKKEDDEKVKVTPFIRNPRRKFFPVLDAPVAAPVGAVGSSQRSVRLYATTHYPPT